MPLLYKDEYAFCIASARMNDKQIALIRYYLKQDGLAQFSGNATGWRLMAFENRQSLSAMTKKGGASASFFQ